VTFRPSVVVTFLALCAACGSKGGSNEPSGFDGNEAPEFDDEAPVNGYDAPTQGYEPPTNNASETPGSNVNAPQTPGGSGSATCLEFCSSAIGAGCVEEQPGACAAACESGEIEEEYGECADEFYAILICIVESPQFVCMETDIEDAEFAECQDEALLYSECADLQEPRPDPEPEPNPQECAPPTCACGGDACLECLCLSTDVTVCTTACGG